MNAELNPFLATPLSSLLRLTDPQKTALKKIGLITAGDLLYYFPVRYGDSAEAHVIANLVAKEEATVFGKITNLKTSKAYIKKIPMSEATITDDSGSIKAIWFNQPYIAKMIKEGSLVKIQGKTAVRRGEIYFTNPKIENVTQIPLHTEESIFGAAGESFTLYPVYRETRGISSNWLFYAFQKVISRPEIDSIEDLIPSFILEKYNLPSWKTAMVWIHSPKKLDDGLSARKRFSFEEIFLIQLRKQKDRMELEKEETFKIPRDNEMISRFLKRFPFKPTDAQDKAIERILSDMESGKAMSRLLEGDVGSGKTLVAAATAFAIISTRPKGQNFGALQVAYMAPTEILAKQHFESFSELLKDTGIQIALITGSGCFKFPSKVNPSSPTSISRSQLLKWVKNGEIPIVIGTHALIQKSVEFKNLAYVIIDEQHRFGTNQRKALARGRNAEKTRKDAEAIPSDSLLYKDLTYRIRQAIFNVKKELGGGHKEVIYQRALEEEFRRSSLVFNKEKQIPITYNKKKIGIYVPDFVIDEKVIVELKSIPFIGQKEKKQLWTYLKGSEYRLALLVNFGNEKLTIDRVVFDTARSASSPRRSAFIPHLLSMTATPIPRTLALTIYGDLDLTLLDQMPVGRKPIKTEIVLPNKRKEMYAKMKEEIEAGRQAYVICPRIDAPDPDKEKALDAKSVKEEAKRLKEKIFPQYSIEIMHSKMTPADKDRVMKKFSDGETKILVSTSVVEVGVNVPNATVILIEGAERFGLSQLHQLRGRVLRSNHQAFCFILSETKSNKSIERLHALIKAKNGFELSELDLSLRGAGDLSGRKQWGISDIGMEAIKNIKMVEFAREEARELLKKDLELSGYPLLRQAIETRGDIHFE